MSDYYERRLADAKARAKAAARRRKANRAKGEAKDYERVRARPIVPGTRYMVTRRTHERRMFLTPDDKDGEEIANFVGFTMGLALRNSGLLMHASLAMSNHHHSNFTDPLGKLPDFKNPFHSFVARGVNSKRGRSDSFWSDDGCCDLEQLDDEQTLGDIVYTYTNPVQAGLVKWPEQWTGFSTYGWRFGETKRFYRPTWFYDPNNKDVPAYIELKLVRPDIFRHLDDDELFELIMRRVRERSIELREENSRKNKGRIRGLAKIGRQRWNEAPKTDAELFKVTPTVASRSKWTLIAALQRKVDWEREYARSRAERIGGGDPEYPFGTYWMRRFAGVRVAAGP